MATVSGYVEKIKFRNDENGYSILSVSSDGDDYILVGTFPYINEGDFIEAVGELVEHPIYGDQIRVERYEMKEPEDTASMERYLGSGAIRGVGTALAARIVRRLQGRYLPDYRGGAGTAGGGEGHQREDGHVYLRADGREEGAAPGHDVPPGLWDFHESGT